MWFDAIGVGEDVFDIEFPVVDEAPRDSALGQRYCQQ
jgi:hypothetical protein